MRELGWARFSGSALREVLAASGVPKVLGRAHELRLLWGGGWSFQAEPLTAEFGVAMLGRPLRAVGSLAVLLHRAMCVRTSGVWGESSMAVQVPCNRWAVAGHRCEGPQWLQRLQTREGMTGRSRTLQCEGGRFVMLASQVKRSCVRWLKRACAL